MAISDRIENALKHYDNKDYQSAMLELSSAIDATAARRQPKAKVGERFRNFIHEHREFVYFGAMRWVIRVMFHGDGDLPLNKIDNTLAKLLYKRVRNPVVHEGGFSKVEIIDEGFMWAGEELAGLGRGSIFALILAVIGDPVNHREQFKQPLARQIGDVHLDFNSLWGKFDDIKTSLYKQSEAIQKKAN